MEELKLKCVDFLLTESMEKLTCWMGGFLQEPSNFRIFRNLTKYILSRWIYGFPLLSQINTTKCTKMLRQVGKVFTLYYMLASIFYCSAQRAIQSERDHTCPFSASDTQLHQLRKGSKVWEGLEAVMAGGRCRDRVLVQWTSLYSAPEIICLFP